MDASKIQSFEQLGIAISLTYLVAGPSVRALLQKHISALQNTSAVLGTLMDNAPNDPDLKLRSSILKTAQVIVDDQISIIAPQNRATNMFYIIMASILTAALTWSTFFDTMPWFVGVAIETLVVITTLRDPYVVWKDAGTLGDIIKKIHERVRDIPHVDPKFRLDQLKSINEGLANFILSDRFKTLKLEEVGPEIDKVLRQQPYLPKDLP